MIYVKLVGVEVPVEVRFYDDWRWDDYQGGFGYVSTLPGIDESPKNPIGFIWNKEKEEEKIIHVYTHTTN